MKRIARSGVLAALVAAALLATVVQPALAHEGEVHVDNAGKAQVLHAGRFRPEVDDAIARVAVAIEIGAREIRAGALRRVRHARGLRTQECDATASDRSLL